VELHVRQGGLFCRVGVLDTPIPNRNQEGVQRLGELLHLIDHWTGNALSPPVCPFGSLRFSFLRPNVVPAARVHPHTVHAQLCHSLDLGG